MSLLVGIDLGTSSIKVVVLSETGERLAGGCRPTPWITRGQRVEADPVTFARAAVAAVDSSLDGVCGTVAAVGVTGFAESGVLIDDLGAPCAPIIAWHDPRGAEAERALRAAFPHGAYERATGQPLTRRATIVKYCWLRSAVGARAGLGRWLSVPEWLIAYLGGDPRPELSQWSRTGFLSIERPEFNAPTADWAGLPHTALPAPARAGTPAGHVAAAHGRMAGATLTAAGHDHLAAAYGAGVAGVDEVFDSWGNGEALLRSCHTPDVERAHAAGFSVSWHVAPDRHALIAGLSTGLLLRGALTRIGVDPDARAGLDEQAAALELAAVPRAALRQDGTLELPRSASPAVAWRAALAAAFERVRAALAGLEAGWGPLERVVGCGGWLASEPLRRLKLAAIEGFECSPVLEPGACGAALLGGVAAEVFGAVR